MYTMHLQFHHLLSEEHYLLLSLNYNLMMAFEAHQWMQDNLALSPPATFSVPFGILEIIMMALLCWLLPSLYTILCIPTENLLHSFSDLCSPLCAFTALHNSTGDLPIAQQLTRCISKLLCNFSLVIHPCNTTVLPHSCIICVQAIATPGVNVLTCLPHLYHWLLQKKTPSYFRRKTLFSRSHFDSSPDTTFHPMSDSISSSVKYFSLLLAQMLHFMNHSCMSSRLKMSQRKQIMWCHHSSDARNLKKKVAHCAW